jgi:hypothetical protein
MRTWFQNCNWIPFLWGIGLQSNGLYTFSELKEKNKALLLSWKSGAFYLLQWRKIWICAFNSQLCVIKSLKFMIQRIGREWNGRGERDVSCKGQGSPQRLVSWSLFVLNDLPPAFIGRRRRQWWNWILITISDYLECTNIFFSIIFFII